MRLAAFLIALAAPVAAQDHTGPGHWYDLSCCALNDCAPVSMAHVSMTDAGYRLTLGPGDHKMVTSYVDEVIPYADARVSKDGDFHACIRGSKIDEPESAQGVICLYVPPMSF